MAKNFNFQLSGQKQLEKIIRRYKWRGKNFDKFLVKGVEKGMMPIQRLLKTKYLSGGILNVQTGRLRSSTRTWAEEKKSMVFGIVGTNVKYAPAHEFGFSGNVSVPSHFRLSKLGKAHNVKTYSKYINLRERAPYRIAVREEKDEFMKIVLRTMMRGLGKK